MSVAVEFGEKAAADQYRDEHDEYICSIDDDARKKTVHFVEDTPEWLIEQARAEADEGLAARESTIGQAELTDPEKERIDFSEGRANVPWARSIKALAQHHNVSDWTAHVDPTLTVDEHREVMERAGRQGGGARDDADQRDADRERRAAAREQDERCDHARGYCENGDPEACEFLRDACNYDEEEVSRLLSDESPAETTQEDLVTVGGERFEEMEVTQAQATALRKSWQGYKGAVSQLKDALETVREEVTNARQAMAVINRVRGERGREDLHPNQLHALLEALEAMPGDIPVTRTLDHFRDENDEVSIDYDDPAEVAARIREQRQALADELEAVDPEDRRRIEQGVAPRQQLDDAVGGRTGEHRTVDRHNPNEQQEFEEMAESRRFGPRYDSGLPSDLPDQARMTQQVSPSPVHDLPNGFEYVGKEDTGNNLTIYRWEAPSDVPGVDVMTITLMDKSGRFELYAGPDGETNPVTTVAHDVDTLAEAIAAAEELAAKTPTKVSEQAIERDDQQTLQGGSADPQTRLAGGEQGERGQGRVEQRARVERNAGGIMADRREATRGEQETKQAIPDEFNVAEGGQETL